MNNPILSPILGDDIRLCDRRLIFLLNSHHFRIFNFIHSVSTPRHTNTFAHTLNPQISRWLSLFLPAESLDSDLIYAIGLEVGA